MNETKKHTYHIAVTGLNAIDNPGPGVAVIRSLKECNDFDIRIIGLSYEALEPGIYLHQVVDKTYQIPYPSAGTESLYNRICHIHQVEKLDLIIPNFDAELFNFTKLKDKFMALGIRTFLPDLMQLEVRDKLKLSAFGEKFGFKTPETKIINKAHELAQACEMIGFPLVIKGKFYDASIVNSQEEAEKVFFKTQAKWGLPIIVQQFINGTEINVAALGDGNKQALSVIPMRKLYITDKGKAWAGITIDSEEFIELGHRFVESTNWKGGCELEVIQTSGGEIYLLEVNPRFPAWIYLTVAAGQNQPAMLVKLAMGQQLTRQTDYHIGKIFIRYAWDHITDINEFQQISVNGEL